MYCMVDFEEEEEEVKRRREGGGGTGLDLSNTTISRWIELPMEIRILLLYGRRAHVHIYLYPSRMPDTARQPNAQFLRDFASRHAEKQRYLTWTTLFRPGSEAPFHSDHMRVCVHYATGMKFFISRNWIFFFRITQRN